jgi:hypothetical protein
MLYELFVSIRWPPIFLPLISMLLDTAFLTMITYFFLETQFLHKCLRASLYNCRHYRISLFYNKIIRLILLGLLIHLVHALVLHLVYYGMVCSDGEVHHLYYRDYWSFLMIGVTGSLFYLLYALNTLVAKVLLVRSICRMQKKYRSFNFDQLHKLCRDYHLPTFPMNYFDKQFRLKEYQCCVEDETEALGALENFLKLMQQFNLSFHEVKQKKTIGSFIYQSLEELLDA